MLLSTVAAPVCIPTHSAPGFPFSTSSPALVVYEFIDDGHSEMCKVIVVLICISLMISDTEYLFIRSLSICMNFFGNVSVQVLCAVFTWNVWGGVGVEFYKFWTLNFGCYLLSDLSLADMFSH